MSTTEMPLSPRKELEAARIIIRQQQEGIEALESDLINANMNLEIMTHRAEAFENAAREFEHTAGVFSFACFCCTYKIEADAHKCGLLDDEVCEELENWEFDEARFAGGERE